MQANIVIQKGCFKEGWSQEAPYEKSTEHIPMNNEISTKTYNNILESLEATVTKDNKIVSPEPNSKIKYPKTFHETSQLWFKIWKSPKMNPLKCLIWINFAKKIVCC